MRPIIQLEDYFNLDLPRICESEFPNLVAELQALAHEVKGLLLKFGSYRKLREDLGSSLYIIVISRTPARSHIIGYSACGGIWLVNLLAEIGFLLQIGMQISVRGGLENIIFWPYLLV